MVIFRLAAFFFVIAVATAPAQSPSESGTTPRSRIEAQDGRRLQPSNAITPRLQSDSSPDNTCLKMRVYKVARDEPNTDSMHPVGYTTCSPAVRFRTYSIEEVIPHPTR